ncbi:MAG: hypothetical protein ABIK39_04560 [candidate division WOR-3 bacterium]
MKSVSIEEIWRLFSNKYLALNVAALEVRRIIDALSRDEIQLPTNPFDYALHRLLRGELKFAPLSESEYQALVQKGLVEFAGSGSSSPGRERSAQGRS